MGEKEKKVNGIRKDSEYTHIQVISQGLEITETARPICQPEVCICTLNEWRGM